MNDKQSKINRTLIRTDDSGKQLPGDPWTDEQTEAYITLVEQSAKGRKETLGDEYHAIDFMCGASIVLFAVGGTIPPAWFFNGLRGDDPFDGPLGKKADFSKELD